MTTPLRDLDLAELRRRTSIKWRRYPDDVLPMWVAEMDSQLAPSIVTALHEALARNDTGYHTGTAYAEALRDFATARWGWEFDITHTTVMPDVMVGMTEVVKLITQAGDPVIVTPPVYPPFYAFLESAGRQPVDVPLTTEGRLDFDGLARAFLHTKTFWLCSPHNPTGTVHTRAELTALADLAQRHGVRVVVDEIHAPLTLPGATFTPYLSLPGTENAFVLMSASKAWNLAALKGALAIAGPQAASELARVPERVAHGVSHFGVMAHVAALQGGGPWLDALLSDLDGNRRLLGELLPPEIGYRMPEATYLTWLDCRKLGLGDDPAQVFLDKGRLAVNSGPTFGPGGAGHVRMNIATSPELIAEGVRRLYTCLLAS